jgi:hypothetical protein
MANEIFNQYDCSLEEDYAILKADDEETDESKKLSFNLRNCVLMRSGEKEILTFMRQTVDDLLPLFDMDFKVSNLYV